ncbi:RmlC-like jelly roll fold protein [Niveomyces insectorum RCEF 264]|uniref:RmlC-like jelly roll fold protein n=1 Tax=Niveomyces insectorum RCEF 264 TaxID=1081102 RepID=A0A162LC97_9HYPO|nr:RmlC-like jelly roll fold protein [Niveomyces insectorum RCEF 264]
MSLIQKEFFTRPPHPPIGASPVPKSQENQWYTIGPGIWELVLNGEADSDNKSVLQWYEPNTTSVTDEIITHTYIEEVCFIEGGLSDVTLGEGWGPGSYAYRLPGMKHGPYKASPQGCLQFVKLVPASKQI